MNKLLWLLIGAFSFILRSKGSVFPTRRPSEEEHHVAEQAHWRSQETATRWARVFSAIAGVAAIITAGAAIVGLFAAVQAANEAQRQAEAAQGQLRVMRDEQRPWIKVQPEEIGDVLMSNGLGPQATLFVSFRLTNVGRTPAFNVRFLVEGFAYGFRYNILAERNAVLGEQHRRCERVRHEQIDNPARGVILFPGDSILDSELAPGDARTITSGTMPGDIDRAMHEGDGKTFVFYLYGCADYAFEGGAQERHQTGVVSTFCHVGTC